VTVQSTGGGTQLSCSGVTVQSTGGGTQLACPGVTLQSTGGGGVSTSSAGVAALALGTDVNVVSAGQPTTPASDPISTSSSNGLNIEELQAGAERLTLCSTPFPRLLAHEVPHGTTGRRGVRCRR
jgi:hypothetical protein